MIKIQKKKYNENSSINYHENNIDNKYSENYNIKNDIINENDINENLSMSILPNENYYLE